MTRRSYFLLFLLGLAVPLSISIFQSFPGYLDSDYYFSGGLQLAQGKGFNEPYLWNYLDDPKGLPHPSHAYWMPLASIITALGMWLTGSLSYESGRIIFILIAGLIPPLTASLAYTFSQRKDLAITSGLLGAFSVFHAPFMAVPDNFGILMLLGGLYFILVNHKHPWFWLGVLAGFMAMARNDGLLWLGLTILYLILCFASNRRLTTAIHKFSLAVCGFFLVMSPWYLRNFTIYGSAMAPGGSRTLWLANYEQTFTYPANLLTPGSWLSQGWREVMNDRLWALFQNLENGFAAHGAIILFPFILIGIWMQRRDPRVQLGSAGWLILLLIMTIAFPFAGARGGFFHAGSAFQPLWWSLAPIGLEAVVSGARKRGWFTNKAQLLFRMVMVQIVILLTVYVVWLRIFSLGWGEGEQEYSNIETFLVDQGAQAGDIVIVRNPPGYYIAAERSAIIIPYGDEQTILAVADRYQAAYLILEPKAALPLIKDLYTSPDNHDHFEYLGEIDETRIFRIHLN